MNYALNCLYIMLIYYFQIIPQESYHCLQNIMNILVTNKINTKL